MTHLFNIYCDESCHLEHDGQPLMVLGAVWCPIEKTKAITKRIREIKIHHGLATNFEVKWNKVSPAKLDFYLSLMDFFFDDDDLAFRALVATQKNRLRHTHFNQDHDEWYYKMYFDMLKVLLNPNSRYRIYLDIKDTRGEERILRLREVLSDNMYDFRREIIERIQRVRSHEVALLQLADLLIGVVSYANRGLQSSEAKNRLVARMRERSEYDLTRTTLLLEQKVNLFLWTPQ